MADWAFSGVDERVAMELAEFLPERIFDAHAHIYRLSDLHSTDRFFIDGPKLVCLDAWRERVGRQVDERRLRGGLFVPMPTAHCEIGTINSFVVEQLAGAPESRGLIAVSPDTPRDGVAGCLENPDIVGFKPYHLFSTDKPTFQSPIGSFLPDWVWEVADREGLVIMLHLVKDQALADPENQSYIRRMCLSYPNARLILAHCARGFHAPNTVRGLSSLGGLQNVWFDTSGICESAPIAAVLEAFGPTRLLWGSDFPVSEMRARCVTVGDNFAWVAPDKVADVESAPACSAMLVGLESLRAVREAAEVRCLDRDDLDDIFFHNARRLFGLHSEQGNATQALYDRAKKRIPGGVQLFSKRPEVFAPDQWPAYFREARGCEVWDLDGGHYYDMSLNGIGACLLGFRDADVTRAVQRRINLGSMCTLNPPEEVELADLLCDIHPWAEQVRFTRTGGEAVSVAVRIARATTDRSVIAVCGYHGWHDWYLAANLGETDALRGHTLPGLDPLGVPRELRGTTVGFQYHDMEAFESILKEHGESLAAVIMEPCRYYDPEPGFLERIRDRAHEHGALLVFDEITIGWRLCLGGAHMKLGVNPDIAVFAKALGNGYPMGAVIGTRAAMEGAHQSFISSTYWTESIGPAAALATIRKLQRTNAPERIAHIGQMVSDFWREHARKHTLPVEVGDGYPCFAHFRFVHDMADELRTLYTQLMLERGFLAGISIYPTLAHTEEVVRLYGAAIDEVFAETADALRAHDIETRLKGPVAHSSFRRLI